MSNLKSAARPIPDDLEPLASDLSATLWNRFTQLPQFKSLHPRDFPLVYEIVHSELKRLGIKANGKGNPHA
jgi:hypothetical protein